MPLLQLNKSITRRIVAAGLALTLLVSAPGLASAQDMGTPTDTVVDTVPGDGTVPGEGVTPPDTSGGGTGGGVDDGMTLPDTSGGDVGGEEPPAVVPPVPEPILPAAAPLPAAPQASPIGPAQADRLDFPEIQVQGNLVLDPFNRYTGYFEISLKILTADAQAFRLIGTTLQYNKDVLTPVDWNDNVITPVGDNYSTLLPTRKSDAVTAGMARVGGTDGYLYLGAESDWGVSIQGAVADVPVVVVRFQYDKANAPLTFDAVNNQFLNKAGDPVELFNWIDEAAAPTCFERSPAGQAVWYESKDTSFYYVPAYDKNNTQVEDVTVDIGGTPYIYPAPITVGKRVQAVAATGDPVTNTDYISFTTNHLTGAVETKSVSRVSDDGKGGGISMSDVATLVFFDWDDSVLGATVVARGVDNRKTVNDFVLDNMVHLDLKTNINYSSMDRADTYRGEYPSIGPSNGATVTNGGNYPLTNKLDYVFYKKVVAENTDSTSPDFGKGTITAPSDADYPYIHGWQAVTPLTMADTWTALDAGQAIPAADFTDIQDGTVYVKALYEPGTEFENIGATVVGGEKSFYTCNLFAFEMLDTTNIKLSFNIGRINADGYGVRLLHRPGFRLQYTFEQGSMWATSAGERTEKQEVLIVIPTIAKNLSLRAIDSEEPGINNYLQATANSLDNLFLSHDKDINKPSGGYVGDVIAETFNASAKEQVNNLNTTGTIYAQWNTGIGASQFEMLNVVEELANIGAQYPPAASNQTNIRNIAKNRIVMYKAACGNRALTYQEIVAAISMNTDNFLINTITPAYLKFRVQSLMDAYTINGKELNVPQMLKVLQYITATYGASPAAKLTTAEIQNLL